MRTLFRGIGWRIFFSFSTLLIVLTLVLSLVGLRYSQKVATDNAANELRVLSVTLSNDLQQHLRRIESNAHSFSGIGSTLDLELKRPAQSRKRIQQLLDKRLPNAPSLETLAVFDLNGLCIAATDPLWIETSAQREAFFVNGLKHFEYAEVFESGEEQEKTLIYSTPIGEGQNPSGVLVGEVRLTAVYDLLDQQLAVSGASEAFLLDKKLRFITPGKSAPDELLESHLTATPLVHHLHDEFWVGLYKNYKGADVLGTVLKLTGYEGFLVIERDYSEVQRQLEAVKRSLFSATLILMVALVLTTVLLTHSITRPLESLLVSAQRIASGDLQRPVEIPKGSDEIAFLAREFDRMRAQVAAAQGRLRERLEESEQRRIESERLAAIGTLASSLAHEIRNPLNAMSLLLSQFERSLPEANHRQRATLENMRGEIGRLDRLVSDILDYARPLTPHLQKTDVVEFLQSVLDFYRGEFERSGVVAHLDAGGVQVSLQIDVDRMRQALVNLIQNSLEAVPAGHGSIDLILREKGDLVVLEVADNGPGIPSQNQRRIFDLFFTTKEKGTGLGLSNVRKIVEAHGGYVVVSSEAGQGTRVALFLPKKAVA